MKVSNFLATYCLSAIVVLASPGFLTPEDEAIIGALAGYGVDAHQHVNISNITPQTNASWSMTATIACRVLSEIFPAQQLIQREETVQYTEWQLLFWSMRQSDVRPACIFQPAEKNQVAVALLVARLARCPFAVKSGGHAAFPGASSIPDGLTIDLKGLNSITLAPDKKAVNIGTGNRWIDVYDKLAPKGLTAVGALVADIGVGGLTLGGGISFYTAQYAFTCDNVDNYEVVVADGRILQVNPQSHPDLYWAMRGGGNNFGIVVGLDLATYPAENLWSGMRVYTMEHKEVLLDAVVKFGHDWPSDPKAHLIFGIGYTEGTGLGLVNLDYTEPVENPPIFDLFEAIPNVLDTTGIKTLPEVSREYQVVNPNGLRESYWTATTKFDIDMVTFVVDTFMSGVEMIKNYEGSSPVLTLKILTPSMLEKMSRNGGNALGLDAADGPLLLILVSCMWENEADDAIILATISDTIHAITTEAKDQGKLNRYLYMNYASEYQNVIPSYGEENHARLVQIAEKYDPHQVFQRLQPGYFKLTGAPKPSLHSIVD